MKNLTITLLAFVLLVGISSCSKQIDTPPAGGVDPNIKVNFSLDSLIGRYNGSPYLITDSLVVSAVVVGDDSSGTFYHQLDIEDSTSGILLGINGSYLYNLYPVGTRLFIHLKGLYLVDNKGAFEIVDFVNTDGTYTGIPTAIESQYITPGKWGIQVAPKQVTIAQLNANITPYLSELVQLTNVQFSQTYVGTPYYVAGNYGNTTLRDCGGEDLIDVYTSSYTDFGNMLTPTGNGTMLCIPSIYVSSSSGRSTNELLIRTPADLNMTGQLCP